jgi:hypothetical protein
MTRLLLSCSTALTVAAVLILPRSSAADPITVTLGGTLNAPVFPAVTQQFFGITPTVGDPFVFSFDMNLGVDLHPEQTSELRNFTGRLSLNVASQSFSADQHGQVFTEFDQGQVNFFVQPDGGFFVPVVPFGDLLFIGFDARFSGVTLGGTSAFDFSESLLNDAPLRAFRMFGIFYPADQDGENEFAVALLSGRIDTVSVTASPVPEPASMLLLATGLLGCAGRIRFRRVVTQLSPDRR